MPTAPSAAGQSKWTQTYSSVPFLAAFVLGAKLDQMAARQSFGKTSRMTQYTNQLGPFQSYAVEQPRKGQKSKTMSKSQNSKQPAQFSTTTFRAELEM